MMFTRRVSVALLLLGCLAVLTQGIASVTSACRCLNLEDAAEMSMTDMGAHHSHASNHNHAHDCCLEEDEISAGVSATSCSACDCQMVLPALQAVSSHSVAAFHEAQPEERLQPSLTAMRPEPLYRPPITLAF